MGIFQLAAIASETCSKSGRRPRLSKIEGQGLALPALAPQFSITVSQYVSDNPSAMIAPTDGDTPNSNTRLENGPARAMRPLDRASFPSDIIIAITRFPRAFDVKGTHFGP